MSQLITPKELSQIPNLHFDFTALADRTKQEIAKAFVDSPDFFDDVKKITGYLEEEKGKKCTAQAIKSLIKTFSLSDREAAKLYHSTGFTVEAYPAYWTALFKAEEDLDFLGQAKAFCNLGILNYNNEEFEEMEVCYKKAIKLLKQTNDIGLKAKINYNLSIVYSNKELYEKAIVYFENALTLAEDAKDIKLQVEIYDKLASIYYTQEDSRKAIEYLEKAFNLAEQTEDIQTQIVVGSNLSTMYLDEGEEESKQEYIQRITEMTKNAKDLPVEYYMRDDLKVV